MLDQISRTMPFTGDGQAGGSLAMSTYVDIVARILEANGFPAGALFQFAAFRHFI